MIEQHRHHHDEHRPFAAASALLSPRHRTRRSDAQPPSSRGRPLLQLLALLVISSTTADAFASRLHTKPSLLTCVVNLQGGASGGGSDTADRTTAITALQASSSASSTSSSASASGVAATVREVQTAPIPGMKPGTSGLRKKVEVWQGEHYVENFLQALIETAAARSPNQQVPDTYVQTCIDSHTRS